MVEAKTALITGASRNIGANLARRLAAKGTTVAVVARSAESLQVLEAEIAATGGRVFALPGDLTVAADIDGICASATERLGGIDILVHCAVVRLEKPFLETTDGEIENAMRVSTWSAVQLSRALLPGMVSRGWGRIVSLIGSGAQTGAAGRVGHVIAKASLLGLTKSLALEFAEFGVTVNAVSPGGISTERGAWTIEGKTEQQVQDRYADAAQRIPARRLGTIDEVCAAVEFLLSDEASFVTGQVLHVNGGRYT